MSKIYVNVTAQFDEDGVMRPLWITWSDGRKFKRDKVKGCCRAASLKAGGVGVRYTCIIEGQERYLFLEENKWFVEGKY